ncbi:acetyl-CoA synthetase-like protein [Pluteus cervinus]|uniref:Acetyl-CoA synthetase-like protein n=1 Tax=Pluteus cervinus TaxID=181527 RepID=A0ACD3BGI6_9AGAR|nr:acetyl-CoA synthetase-like protein [Pluteus cervinus]
MFNSHFSVLDASVSRTPSAPVFKTPVVDSSSGSITQWNTVTYEQFSRDIQNSARYWASTLRAVPPRSVIGLWIGGFTYTDVLHIYGISRAGYVPQLFSLRLPNPSVIYELLHRAQAKAIIYDPNFASSLESCPVPHFPANDVIPASTYQIPTLPPVTESSVAFIFHTSGSTSGSPKLVPCTYRWLDSVVTKTRQTSKPIHGDKQDVTVWMGSMCHIGQSFMLIGSLQHGSCVIQPTKIAFSSDELIDMIQRCGLNRLNQFAAFLAGHLRQSRKDAKLLSILCNLDEVLYSGLPLPRDEEEWAYSQGIRLKNLFGSTECGAMMLSVGGKDRHAPLLMPLKEMSYRFESVTPAEAGHQTNARLMELVILSDSPDCPDTSLRHGDPHFHTGDLFQEVAPGMYAFRGRDDDWIKTETSLRCDTKAIEDNTRAMCGNLIAECVVVGTGRPSPVMFVEPVTDMDHDKLTKEIIRKTRQFHSRRYLHERITSHKMIVVVPSGTLPRTVTKGNIRRKAVEEAFKDTLDSIHGVGSA